MSYSRIEGLKVFERTARGQEGANRSAADQQSREDKIARVERSEDVTIGETRGTLLNLPKLKAKGLVLYT